MRRHLLTRLVAAVVVCVTGAIGPSGARAESRIIMDYDFDYVVGGDLVGDRSYRAHRTYGMPGERFTDLDGDGEDGDPADPNNPADTRHIGNDDSQYILDFSLTDPFNPDDYRTIPFHAAAGTGYDTTLPGAVFYGGAVANLYNVNATAWSQATVQSEPQAGGTPGNRKSVLTFFPYWNISHPTWYPGDWSDDTTDWTAVFVWKQEDFFNGANDRRVEFDDDSYMKIRWYRDWGVETARFVVQNGDQLYVAHLNIDPVPSMWGDITVTFDPLDLDWAVYNPTSTEFNFDQDAATYLDPDVGQIILDDITAVGVYFDRDTADTNDAQAVKFPEFEVFANVVTGVADVNNDGMVDVADLGLLALQWNTSGELPFNADINDDDVVSVADLGVLGAQWDPGAGGASLAGQTLIPVPIAGVSGMAMAGLLVLRRRRVNV